MTMISRVPSPMYISRPPFRGAVARQIPCPGGRETVQVERRRHALHRLWTRRTSHWAISRKGVGSEPSTFPSSFLA
jgi:hypothetical protein